jgi:hypothetical protein
VFGRGRRLNSRVQCIAFFGIVPTCVVPAWVISTRYRNEFTLNAAYLHPRFASWCTGLLFLVLGIVVVAVSDTRPKLLLGCCETLLGGLWLFQVARSYASFDAAISYRSPTFLRSVEVGYDLLEHVEVEEACRTHQRYIHQVVLHFHGGRQWRSAVDGMLDDEKDVQQLLRVIRVRAPTVRYATRLLPSQVLIFFEVADQC